MATMTATGAAQPALLGLARRVPRSAAPGRPIVCEWVLTNRGPADVSASLYLSVSERLIALTSAHGSARLGRYHGNARLLIPLGARAVVRAALVPLRDASCTIRLLVLTRHETLELNDVITPEVASTYNER